MRQPVIRVALAQLGTDQLGNRHAGSAALDGSEPT
jgi:hypothetical protein